MKLAVWIVGLLLVAGMSMAEAAIQVRLEGDRLTLSAQDAPLEEILQAVAAAGRFSLRLETPLTDPITVQWTQRPLLEVLDWLLGDQSSRISYLILYMRRREEVRVETVQVFAPSPPPGLAETVRQAESARPDMSPAPAEVAMREGLPPREAAPADRIADAFTLAEGGQAEKGREVLVDLIYADTDPAVRGEALAVLTQFAEVPLEPVATAAQADKDPSVRLLAVALLADRAKPEAVARGILQKVASEDEDADVRLVAMALLGGDESGYPGETGSP